MDDVTAWCILAFVVAVARAQGMAQALWITMLALAFILAMVGIVRPFLRRLGARVVNGEGLTPPVVAVTLLLLILPSGPDRRHHPWTTFSMSPPAGSPTPARGSTRRPWPPP